MDIHLGRQEVGGDMIDDGGDVLDHDSAFELRERLADFFHGVALGGADVDDEDAVVLVGFSFVLLLLLLLACGGESAEFAVKGVDS